MGGCTIYVTEGASHLCAFILPCGHRFCEGPVKVLCQIVLVFIVPHVHLSIPLLHTSTSSEHQADPDVQTWISKQCKHTASSMPCIDYTYAQEGLAPTHCFLQVLNDQMYKRTEAQPIVASPVHLTTSNMSAQRNSSSKAAHRVHNFLLLLPFLLSELLVEVNVQIRRHARSLLLLLLG